MPTDQSTPPILSRDRKAPTAEAIRAQLQRVLANRDFDASERNRDFLLYVVEQTLVGKASYNKGYSVAQNVLKRSADFDPQLVTYASRHVTYRKLLPRPQRVAFW